MDKIEYITNQLKKTFGKKFENYCITRIYNLVNREDLKIITQQLFKREDGKIALADLYLPQINIWVEIDEGQHIKNKELDNERTKEVIDNNVLSEEIKKKYDALEEVVFIKKEKPYRIDVFNKSLEEINKQIDDIVLEINERIKEQGENFMPWNEVFADPDKYNKIGYLTSKDNAKFRTLDDIGKLFGFEQLKMNQKINGYFNILKNVYVWSPIVIIEGNECDSNGWYNVISDDSLYIYEYQKDKSEDYLSSAIDNKELRFVFVKYKDETGTMVRKFIGGYSLDVEKSKQEGIRIWKHHCSGIDLNFYKDNRK